MTSSILNARVALIAGTLLAIAPALQAQEPTPPPNASAPATGATPSATIPDAKVDQFAAAFVAVQTIQAQATQQLSSASDEKQASDVKAAAEQQMVEAVEREGLQVEEFNRIADLLTTDTTLRARVVDKVQKRTKG